MCGIAAIIDNNKLYNHEVIGLMTDIIRHRGPDSSGSVSLCDGRVILGHRRLSILDLSELGKQPMLYNNRYCITYNGEIYNYKELKNELITKGYSFKSNTDTEVIMAAYDFWGKNCLNKFNGMWAFVLVDIIQKKIFVARDRFGVKPLYYRQSSSGTVVFASEIKQFTVLPDWLPKINGQRAYDYLRWGQSDHTSETMFEGVNQIGAGEALEIKLDDVDSCAKLPIYKWYHLSYQYREASHEDNIKIFKEMFFDAVNIRLRSDVSVGSCLSGGLDSSSIVCTVNDILKDSHKQEQQYTVSAASRVKKYDETEYVDAVLTEREISGLFIYPEFDQLFDSLNEIIWHQDEPFGSTSIFAQWNVFLCASTNDLKVMLDGQGADEQLAGYHAYFAPLFTSLLKKGALSQLINEIRATDKMHGYNMLFALKGIFSELLPENVCNLYRKYGTHNEIAPRWINMDKLKAKPHNPTVDLGEKAYSIRQLSIAQLTSSNLQKLLHWEDRDSMAHSIESRLPFLDYRLVEFILGLPDEYKIKNGVTKKILRESMKGILPEKIRTRMDKMGFVTPEEYWIRSKPDIFRKEIECAIDASNGILTKDCLFRFDDIIANKRSFDSTIWRMICFGRWIKRFNIAI